MNNNSVLKVEERTHFHLKAFCKKNGLKMGFYVNKLILDDLDRHGHNFDSNGK